MTPSSKLKKLRDTLGWIFVGSSWLALCLAVLLSVYVAVISYRYDISLPVAAKGVLRELSLIGIRAAVSVSDPSKPRFAWTGPDINNLPNRADYVRIEQVLGPDHTVATPSGRRITVQEVHNEVIIRSPFVFRYQPYDEPRLHELRRKYRLEEVVAGATNEFDGMMLLLNWTRSQFRRRDYQPSMDNFDALEILDRNWRDHGEPYSPHRHMDPCHFFPMFYCQIMLSMGHQARLMSVSGHGVAEVWSNLYRKWFMADVELNHYFEKGGVPLNMVEILEENYTRTPGQVRLIRGKQTSDVNTTMVHLHIERPTAERMLPRFNHLIDLIDLRNDWMTNHYFPGHPARSDWNSLIFMHPRVKQPVSFNGRLRRVTADKEKFYWTLNQTEVWVQRRAGDVLELAFDTVTPNFDYFDVVVDGHIPIRLHSPTYQWPLHAGANTLTVRAVNLFGVRGIESAVKLSVSGSGP